MEGAQLSLALHVQPLLTMTIADCHSMMAAECHSMRAADRHSMRAADCKKAVPPLLLAGHFPSVHFPSVV